MPTTRPRRARFPVGWGLSMAGGRTQQHRLSGHLMTAAAAHGSHDSSSPPGACWEWARRRQRVNNSRKTELTAAVTTAQHEPRCRCCARKPLDQQQPATMSSAVARAVARSAMANERRKAVPWTLTARKSSSQLARGTRGELCWRGRKRAKPPRAELFYVSHCLQSWVVRHLGHGHTERVGGWGAPRFSVRIASVSCTRI